MINIHTSQKEETGRVTSKNVGSENKPRPSLPIFNDFEELFTYLEMQKLGSYYERKNGLTPRCFYGVKQTEDFGTITYVTNDGRVALIWAFGTRAGWFYIYPTSEQIDYFYKEGRQHIVNVLTNNNKEYKL